jgi:hypothetical protein
MSTCEKFASLTDAQSLGDSLEAGELEFVAEHQKTCEFCRSEARLYGTLEGILEAAPPRIAFEVPPIQRKSSRPRVLALLAGAAAIAAAAAWFVRASPDSISPVTLARAHIAVAQSVRVNGALAQAGQQLHVGDNVSAERDTCLKVEPSVDVCLSGGAMVQVEDLSLSHRRLRLLAGSVKSDLQPQPVGTSFGIVTRDSESVAVGTSFQVAIEGESAGSVTRVFHGIVAVQAQGQAPRRVVAHQSFESKTKNLRAMTAAEEGALVALVAAPVSRDIAGSQVVSIESVPSAAQVTVDGRVAGETPVSLLLAPGTHRVEIAREGHAPEQHTIDVRDSAQSLNVTLSEVVPTAVEAAPTEMTPERLLGQAKLALSHREFDSADEVMERLETTFPKSAQARVALLARAELKLDAQNDAASALPLFDAYLQRGGSLREQALFGKIRALRVLNRTEEMNDALRRVKAEFPKSQLLEDF